jgi:hypothetical protein
MGSVMTDDSDFSPARQLVTLASFSTMVAPPSSSGRLYMSAKAAGIPGSAILHKQHVATTHPTTALSRAANLIAASLPNPHRCLASSRVGGESGGREKAAMSACTRVTRDRTEGGSERSCSRVTGCASRSTMVTGQLRRSAARDARLPLPPPMSSTWKEEGREEERRRSWCSRESSWGEFLRLYSGERERRRETSGAETEGGKCTAGSVG